MINRCLRELFSVNDVPLKQGPVLAKYAGHAGHVRQTFADVRQRAPTLPDILSDRGQYTETVKQGELGLPDICVSHQLRKMSGRDQNVRQRIQGLPDILSGRHEIIFARTEGRTDKQTNGRMDRELAGLSFARLKMSLCKKKRSMMVTNRLSSFIHGITLTK